MYAVPLRNIDTLVLSTYLVHLTCHGCDKPHQCWIMFANNRYLLCCRPGAMHHAQRRLASPWACLASNLPLSLSLQVQLFFATRLRYLRMLLSQSGGKCDFVCVLSSYSHTGGVGPAWDLTSLTWDFPLSPYKIWLCQDYSSQSRIYDSLGLSKELASMLTMVRSLSFLVDVPSRTQAGWG